MSHRTYYEPPALEVLALFSVLGLVVLLVSVLVVVLL